MANVTKIKFQYFKPLERGTTEHTGGEQRKAGTGGHGRTRHPREGPRRRGRPGGRGAGAGGRGRGGAWGDAPLPHGRQRRPDSRAGPLRARRPADLCPEAPGPAIAGQRQAAGLRRSRRVLHCHRDPTRRQRLPRERPSAPGARGKSPNAPMSERLPPDGHARGRGFPSPLPSSGNPL